VRSLVEGRARAAMSNINMKGQTTKSFLLMTAPLT
jgi:hypothetical protein